MNSNNIGSYFNRYTSFDQNNVALGFPSEVFKASKWTLQTFQEKKLQLNKAKRLVHQFELDQWRKHTKRLDPACHIVNVVKNAIKPELLTQAWCKLYECLSRFPVIGNNVQQLNSLHLCEAPGAFVCALNHYLLLNCASVQWRWIASTLNPDYEGNPLNRMIADDTLVRHTEKNWCFGVDRTGDLTNYENHKFIIETVRKIGQIQFVTADGSINCMSDPGEQEQQVVFLIYCEICTALAVLAQGGSFILKIFTFFEDTTICLLYLLHAVFQNVYVFKPASSKSGNSELYLICLNYFGLRDEILNQWDSIIAPYKCGLFPENKSLFDEKIIPQIFRDYLEQSADFFMNLQIKSITDNVQIYQISDDKELEKRSNWKHLIAEKYLQSCNLSRISKSSRIIPHLSINSSYIYEPVEYVFNADVNLLEFNVKHIIPMNLNRIHIEIMNGKRIGHLKYSRFCTETAFKCITNGNDQTSMIENTIRNNTKLISCNHFSRLNYYKYENQIVEEILNVGRLNLRLLRLPLLSHYIVGVIFLKILMYRQIFIHKDGWMEMQHTDEENYSKIEKYLEIIKNHRQNLKDDNAYNIVQLMSPNYFFNNNFFDFIWNYNEIVLKKIC